MAEYLPTSPLIALTPVSPSRLPDKEEARLQELAESLAPRLARIEEDRERYRQHMPRRLPREQICTLQADDFSVIPHLDQVKGLEYYSSRAFIRAREGDLVAAVFEEIPGYLDYFSRQLGLPPFVYCQAEPPPGVPGRAVYTALLSDEASLRKIEALSGDGELWIHPYMGHDGPWRLAERLAQRSRRTVRVLAPLPAVTRWANDKVQFAEAVQAVAGSQAVLEARSGRTALQLAKHLLRLAPGSSSLCLKLADGASGMGTGIFSRDEIRGKSLLELEEFISGWMREMEWDDSQPSISVERWEAETAGSPSIQLWIPPLEDGLPVMEGIFDQLFDSQAPHVFNGSFPSRLPPSVQGRLAEAGIRLGRLFQLLGYVGRCSLDTILKGSDAESAEILFTECNGRWGGTSLPMSFMNRLFGDYRKQPYVSRDFEHPALKGVPFNLFASRLSDVLYDRSSGNGWLVVYNVGCLEPDGMVAAITLGKTFEEAQQRRKEFRRLVEERF